MNGKNPICGKEKEKGDGGREGRIRAGRESSRSRPGKEGRKEEEERKKKRNKSPVPTTLSISSCCQIPGIGRLAPHFSASTLA